jgi:hypothetical protein
VIARDSRWQVGCMRPVFVGQAANDPPPEDVKRPGMRRSWHNAELGANSRGGAMCTIDVLGRSPTGLRSELINQHAADAVEAKISLEAAATGDPSRASRA